MSHLATTPEKQLQEGTRRLVEEFGSSLPAEVVESELRRAMERGSFARIQTYVPIFAYRAAREALRTLVRKNATPVLSPSR